ncbi:MAG TPA: YggS family pyridoxal phosphate-dependent enzyme [Chloroflexota bacterium]|nr:YggS family pyridoxal phosphate-dependent enzyme [Chloroflexota bacterium]
MDSLKDRLARVAKRVALAAERSGRRAADVEMVAVSKTVSAEVVAEAISLGQTSFGENRIQECRDKQDALSGLVGLRWHLIGHLQSNKAKLAVGLFDIIQTVDSVRLAGVLDSLATERGSRLPVLLQVDFSQEPHRSGFAPEEVERAAEAILALSHLEPRGLMTIAPLGLAEPGLRAVFGQLGSLRDRLASGAGRGWTELSMGMSDDFEIAIEEGATIVRVGRAIFGERPRA